MGSPNALRKPRGSKWRGAVSGCGACDLWLKASGGFAPRLHPGTSRLLPFRVFQAALDHYSESESMPGMTVTARLLITLLLGVPVIACGQGAVGDSGAAAGAATIAGTASQASAGANNASGAPAAGASAGGEAGRGGTPAGNAGAGGGSSAGGTTGGVVTNGISHPAMMTTLADLERLKTHVAKGEQPWSQELERLKARVERSGRAIRNPGQDNDVGGGALVYCGSSNKNEAGTVKVAACDWPVDDGIDAYTFALLGYLTGEAAYSEEALAYLESWTNPKNFAGFDPAGSNAPLQHGWTIPWYANAAELLRYTYPGWRAEHTTAMDAFLQRMLPLVEKDNQGAPNNWLHSRIEAHIAAAIFLSDPGMLATGIERWQTHTRSYVYIEADAGTPVLPISSQLATRGKAAWATPKFVAGMTMETCRDFNHQELGMRSIFNSLAMVSNQGRDMLAGNDNRDRLVTFLEFMPVLAQAREDHPYGICNDPVLVNPPDAYLRDTAERVPYEIGYALLRTAEQPLLAAKQELDLSPATGASRWVTKWEGLTHHQP